MNKLIIEFGGFTFQEPMALLLNWVLMIQSFYYFRKLKNWRISNFSIYWRWFFLLFGVSTLFGGPSHFFYAYTGLAGKIPGWLSAVFAITFMELAMSALLDDEWRQRLQILSLVKLGLTCISLLFAFDFNTVIIHTTGMVFFTLIPAIVMLIQRKSDINYIVLGIIALLATLPFRILEVDFHRWFNRDDIGHVLMMVTLFCFFQGVKFRESRNEAWQLAA
jgi:hypothetical protein